MVSRWVLGLVLALVLLLFVGGGLLISRGGSPAPVGDQVITISRSSCGQGWTRPVPGLQTFQLHNSGMASAEVDLIDPSTGTVYGEVEGLGPGTTRPMQVDLGNGTYAFRCLPDETDAVIGPSVTITGGQARSGPAVVPVTDQDLLGPLKAYEAYVAAGLGTLSTQTDALQAAVHGQDRAASESAWLTAHLTYERLGAAYGAFGAADAEINGTADGLPGGTADPGFTGFHRLENGLWHNEPMPALAPVADQLDSAVHTLHDTFGDTQIDQLDLGLRAHEIMENTLQFELTGHTDYGSGTNLATALANLDGTREAVSVLRPVLVSRMPSLPEVDSAMNRVETALRAAQRPDGSWTPVEQLDRTRREKINGSVSELTELLAPIAAIAEPRRTE
jgi:iron uptake system component EfeO